MLEYDNVLPDPDEDSDSRRGEGGRSLTRAERRDLRLEIRAVERRWPTRPEVREAICENIGRHAADPELDPKLSIAAAKAYALMERQNQVDECHFVIVGLAIVVLFVVMIATNPLRRSNESVRRWLQTKTPLGSSLTKVRVVLDEHGWYDERFQRTEPPPQPSLPVLG